MFLFCLSDKRFLSDALCNKIIRIAISRGQILILLLDINQDEKHFILTSELNKVTKSAISPKQKNGSL